jgi:hypothetical protein
MKFIIQIKYVDTIVDSGWRQVNWTFFFLFFANFRFWREHGGSWLAGREHKVHPGQYIEANLVNICFFCFVFLLHFIRLAGWNNTMWKVKVMLVMLQFIQCLWDIFLQLVEKSRIHKVKYHKKTRLTDSLYIRADYAIIGSWCRNVYGVNDWFY